MAKSALPAQGTSGGSIARRTRLWPCLASRRHYRRRQGLIGELMYCRRVSTCLMSRYSHTDPICGSIIAAHGLGANKDYAWLQKKDEPRGITQKVNWLKSLLPVTLRSANPAVRARIFCYNYDSRWLGKDTCTNTLTTISDGLVDALNRKDHQVHTRRRTCVEGADYHLGSTASVHWAFLWRIGGRESHHTHEYGL